LGPSRPKISSRDRERRAGNGREIAEAADEIAHDDGRASIPLLSATVTAGALGSLAPIAVMFAQQRHESRLQLFHARFERGVGHATRQRGLVESGWRMNHTRPPRGTASTMWSGASINRPGGRAQACPAEARLHRSPFSMAELLATLGAGGRD
jgi:hypothetical protein